MTDPATDQAPSVNSDAELAERVAAEIVRHHQVIEAWLSGGVPRADAGTLAAFHDAHTEDFTMVGPDGTLMAGADILRGIDGAHGTAPGLRIRITDPAVVTASGRIVVATYREAHSGTAQTSVRRATVVFVHDDAAKPGLRWRHLHETWEN